MAQTAGDSEAYLECLVSRLPRGRHGLPRETVVRSQRERILRAMADAMVENGYAATTIAQILKRAGVSRETFYELFRSKEDCFEAGYVWSADRVWERLREGMPEPPPADALERMRTLIDGYLDAIVSDPARARVFLVEVYAAGPRLVPSRIERQSIFTEIVLEIVDAVTDQQRFACQTFVAAVNAMVTARVADNDIVGLSGLREPLLELLRRGGAIYGNALAGTSSP